MQSFFKNTIYNKTFIIIVVSLSILQGCGIYSFTGASIPPGAKTISVEYFPNKAQLVEPLLSPVFTNTLRDQFSSQTNLTMVEKKGDLDIQGEIVDYKISPVAIQHDQTAAMNRLTITVNVRFTNRFEPDKDFETKFTQFIDYLSTEDFNSIKAQLIEQITKDLSDNIFNKAVVNW
jgi:hypothetical protein